MGQPRVPLAQKLIDSPLTPSQLRAAKFFLVVLLLFLLQTAFGGLLAHYTVHPGSFYIDQVAGSSPLMGEELAPAARHLIATTWVASRSTWRRSLADANPPNKALVQPCSAPSCWWRLDRWRGGGRDQGQAREWWFWLDTRGGSIWSLTALADPSVRGAHRLAGDRLSRRLHLMRRGSRRPRGLSSPHRFLRLRPSWWWRFTASGCVRRHTPTVADYWRCCGPYLGGVDLRVLRRCRHRARHGRDGPVWPRRRCGRVLHGGDHVLSDLGTAHHYLVRRPSLWLTIGSVFSSMEPVPLFGLVVRG